MIYKGYAKLNCSESAAVILNGTSAVFCDTRTVKIAVECENKDSMILTNPIPAQYSYQIA